MGKRQKTGSLPEGALTWALDEDTGLLAFSGTGRIAWSGKAPPWDRAKVRAVTIPEGVTAIGAYAFYGCKRLARIVIPIGVTAIGPAAFHSCAAPTCAAIPDGVTSISVETFNGCTSLTGVYFQGDAPRLSPEDADYPSFPHSAARYYIEGRAGWTSPAWNVYKTALWNGTDPGGE